MRQVNYVLYLNSITAMIFAQQKMLLEASVIFRSLKFPDGVLTQKTMMSKIAILCIKKPF